MSEPFLLVGHRLELVTAGGAVLAAAAAAGATWWVVGRTLRPVAAIRARTAEITVSDLSLRVPQPPGRDEIAQLARTANRTLARLEQAVAQQRQFASVASHELRSPVAGLRTLLEETLLYPDDVDSRQTIQAALSTTERLQEIIEGVAFWARVRRTAPPEPEPIALGALVTRCKIANASSSPLSG